MGTLDRVRYASMPIGCGHPPRPTSRSAQSAASFGIGIQCVERTFIADVQPCNQSMVPTATRLPPTVAMTPSRL